MRSSLFCDITQRGLLVSYWRFETTHRSNFQWSSTDARRLDRWVVPKRW